MVEGQGRPTFFFNTNTEKIEIEKTAVIYHDDMVREYILDTKTDLLKISPWRLETLSSKQLEYIILINKYAVFPFKSSPSVCYNDARHREYRRDLINTLNNLRETLMAEKK